MIYRVSKKDKTLQGEITLDGSKSISNRVLMIQSLCSESFSIHNLSNSKDTQTLQVLLAQINDDATLDAGAAGTTFRFLTAYLAKQNGTQILTGNARMQQRPIGALVNALRQLGANIYYINKENYPPLRIETASNFGDNHRVTIAAHTSSQFITALLLIAPTLPNGLELTLEGTIVSRPYIEMTLAIMEHFGVQHIWQDKTIKIAPQTYHATDFQIEADWSAASYYYAMAAFADESFNLKLNGLFEQSVQGDAVIAKMMTQLGVKTVFKDGFVFLKKNSELSSPIFEWDFLTCPDLAQTMAIVCGGTGTQGLFTGLDTLPLKETNRIQALQTELAKLQVFLSALPARFSKRNDKTYYMLEGKALLHNPQFATYCDHRMAMAFASLSMLGDIQIENPAVVEKSYPQFWTHIQSLGFELTAL